MGHKNNTERRRSGKRIILETHAEYEAKVECTRWMLSCIFNSYSCAKREVVATFLPTAVVREAAVEQDPTVTRPLISSCWPQRINTLFMRTSTSLLCARRQNQVFYSQQKKKRESESRIRAFRETQIKDCFFCAWMGFEFSIPLTSTSYLILSSHLLAQTVEPSLLSLPLSLSHVSPSLFSLPVLNCCLSWDVVVWAFAYPWLSLSLCADNSLNCR